MHRIRNEEISWREVDDEVVVLDLRTSRYLGLNGTGAMLWKQLADGGAEKPALVQMILREFEDVPSEETAEKDVDAFLEQCAALGLLR